MQSVNCHAWLKSIGVFAQASGVLESGAYSRIGEHFQKPRNAGSRPEAPFFNSLLNRSGRWGVP